MKRNKLYLEGDEIIDLNPDITFEMELSKKKELTVGEYERVVYLAALSKGYFLLSRRDYTSKELRQKLYLKFRAREIVDRSVDKIEEKGYIDDHSYAKSFVERSRDGRKKIEYQLKIKGVSSETIKEAFLEAEHDELESVKLILSKIKNKPLEKKIGYLVRKGFSYDEIKLALEESEDIE